MKIGNDDRETSYYLRMYLSFTGPRIISPIAMTGMARRWW